MIHVYPETICRLSFTPQVNGARDFSDWYPRWLLLYCLQISAVFVTPDYRLLPEAKGTDILEDLRDFFSWMQNDLAAVVNAAPGGGDIDFRKLISTGGSAGIIVSLIYRILAVSSNPLRRLSGPPARPHVPRLRARRHLRIPHDRHALAALDIRLPQALRGQPHPAVILHRRVPSTRQIW